MNITFWLIVSALLAITFYIIIRPLLKTTEIEQADSDQRNIRIAQERADELKQQFDAGLLTQQQYDEQYSELELTLGDDLDIVQHSHQSNSQGRWVIPVIVLCVPVFSVFSYFSLGEPDALIKAELKQPQQLSGDGQDINAMVQQLAQRLKENPDNAKDWIMLGRSFKYLKQYQLAANSFKKAHALLGDEPEVLLHYADSLAMLKNGSLAGKAAEMVFKALEKAPNNVTGLWLAGMAKAEERNFSQAVGYWDKLLTILPPESDSYAQVKNLIAKVHAENSVAKAVENSPPVKALAAVSIEVQVSIAPAIKSRVDDTHTVFIYAKALSGPPMPLAIIRKQVSDLPLTVTLNDAMAMMPAMKLSNFTAVKVMARISKSGTAMQQKGDFIGALDLSELASKQSVAIVVNEEIK